MKLLPLQSAVWCSLLVLWVSQCETQDVPPDVCDEDYYQYDSEETNSSIDADVQISTTVTCCLYPTSILNCSWSFPMLQEDTHISVCISACDHKLVSWNQSSEERVGSKSLFLHGHEIQYVILQFNMSLNDRWKLYTHTYTVEAIEILSSPSNVSASVKDGDLLVTWDLPHSQTHVRAHCLEYELDLGDQIRSRIVKTQSYKQTVDPAQTYRVRIRARRQTHCFLSPEWSDWSPTVTVEQSLYKLNTLVIVLISLGIPMILLAVLLLVRNQRVSELVFPPIPQPPPKYISFLEKNDTHSFFHPAQTVKAEEEITEVEYVEENRGVKL